jgi:hypothetical protein
MSILVLLGTLAAPQPAELRTFTDWTVGCDNGRACHAVALMPESWPEEGMTMSLRRGPEAQAPVEIRFDHGEKPAVALRANGRRLGARLRFADNGLEVAPDGRAEVLAALRAAPRLEVIGKEGATIGTVSLAGASAAMLYMDEQQKRLGTVTALVRSGPKPASAVPPPPPLPVVTAAPVPKAPAHKLPAARLKALRRQAQCDTDAVGGPDYHDISRIGPAHILLLLSCGAGAYNVSYVPYVLTGRGAAVQVRIAPFDLRPEVWDEGVPILVNAEWDPEQRLLTSFAKGRGLGDCGVGRSYAWDGARFRLVAQFEMAECRGSVDYIDTWRATVRR